MKKILPGTELGGVPVNKSDFRTVLNSEIWNAIEGTMSLFDANTEGVIVSGCVITNNAGNFDMTAGIVYLNKEFMRMAAVVNQTYTKYIQPATPTQESRVYGNGTTNNWLENKDAQITGSIPGAGQYITINSLTGAEDRRLSNILINRQVAVVLESTLNVKGAVDFDTTLNVDGIADFLVGFRTQNTGPTIRIKVIDIGDWNMDTTSTVNVNHTIADSTKILFVAAKIVGDVGSGVADTQLGTTDASGVVEGCVSGWTSSQINLFRRTGSNFDTALYDATSYNRGRITIVYEA